MPVHVSIHDVSPAWSVEVDRALALCADAGAVAALLVVPDFHGQWPLREHPAFCERLRRLQRSGHEVYLHGFRHRAPPPPPDSTLRERAASILWQRVVSAGEAEVAQMSEAEGHRSVASGLRVLDAAGLRADGYVAPAWAMPPWLLRVLSDLGVRYTEGHVRIYDLRGGRSRASVVLNWATRSAGRLLSSALWCRAIRPARALLPVRIAIHPGDMRARRAEREVRATLAWARGDFVRGSAELFG
jgi:predicted deacetylase